MDIVEILRLNLLSPMVLAFVLGIIAVRVKSDLRIPEQIYDIISIYLLFAIGLKGGFDLATSSLENFALAAVVTALMGAAIPLWTYVLLHRIGGVDKANAVAMGITFGAVSAVTLSAVISFLTEVGAPFEGYMPTMYVIMEIPAVIVGLLLAQRVVGSTDQKPMDVLTSALSSKSFLLLGGGVVIGFLSGEPGKTVVAPFFIDLFSGILTLFLLDMGRLVGARFSDLRRMGRPLLIFSLGMPALHGLLGVALATAIGLSPGGATILATIAASASYITAPVIIRNNLPQANPGFFLTSSLALAFPFNLALGIPLYYEVALRLAG